jgi:hypothetical protein
MEDDELRRQVDGASLAAQYHLGVPLKRHTHNLDRVVGTGCSALVMAFYLLVLLSVARLILQQHSVLGWIGLLLGFLLTLRLALFFINANKAFGHSGRVSRASRQSKS